MLRERLRGVFSSLLWNVVMKELLGLLGHNRGKVMQAPNNMNIRCTKTKRLNIRQYKSTIMAFTQKTKLEGLSSLYKYQELVLDPSLSEPSIRQDKKSKAEVEHLCWQDRLNSKYVGEHIGHLYRTYDTALIF